ncbi:MAG: hypothetical protein FWG25_11340 [Promicromonosporaceae bacterium]|nr:hypothetical protein [Promicromonosporaceae bacterium]
MSIPVPDPVITVVEPDTDRRRAEKREERLDATQTQQELLDDIYRYRGQLADNIDELHTRISPKYHIDQLKETWTQAGNDALSILKNEGSPADETRKKNAESIIKGGSAVAGLITLHGLRKLLKRASLRRSMRQAVAKGAPNEKIELIGTLEAVETDETPEVIE